MGGASALCYLLMAFGQSGAEPWPGASALLHLVVQPGVCQALRQLGRCGHVSPSTISPAHASSLQVLCLVVLIFARRCQRSDLLASTALFKLCVLGYVCC